VPQGPLPQGLLSISQEHDVGHYESRSSGATLFVVRLLCRTDEVLSLLLQQHDQRPHPPEAEPGSEDSSEAEASSEARVNPPGLRVNPSSEAEAGSLSRLRCSASALAELRRSHAAIRAQIQGSALPMLEAWFARALRDHQVGEQGSPEGGRDRERECERPRETDGERERE